MASKTDEFRKTADDCRQLAKGAKNSFEKQDWPEVALSGNGKSEPRGGCLSPGELTPGTFVIVSGIPDSPLMDAIWEIIDVNDAYCVLKLHRGDRAFLTVVPLHEHDFYRADHLVAA
jgi:hypothetical protein